MVKWLGILSVVILAVVLAGCNVVEMVLQPTLPAVSDATATLEITLLPTFTATLPVETPTETALPVEVVKSTVEPMAVATSLPTSTATPEPTFTPTATLLPYSLQLGAPAYLPNLHYPDLGCNWMAVGGQVFTKGGEPIIGFHVVELGGELDGKPVSGLALTGSAPQWGQGGFEIKIADQPVASNATLWIQLLDLDGNALSEKIPFLTYEDCERSVVLLNLVDASSTMEIFLPSISSDSEEDE